MYTLFVFGLLFPTAVAILPLYILVRQLGLTGNPLGVALPQAAFALPLTIVILRPFFRSIPAELEDAARIDGCSSFGFFWRVLLPLARPALATVSVLAVVGTWNAFLLPLIILNGADQWTVPLGVMNFSTQYASDEAQGARVHGRRAHPGHRVLPVRRAAARRRADDRGGEGLMTTIQARYRDADLPIDVRVADLLARMTPAEKLAQLGSLWSFELFRSETELDPERVRDRLADGIGQVSRVAGATNLDPAGAAEAGNAIQRFLVGETRLGIPAILHEETLHGLLARDAPSFQQSIGAGAAFDPELVEAIAATIRRRMLAIGGRLALAPVLDVTRDPRWGRVEETYGEDPYLATVLGVAYTRGMQGDDIATGVVATGKHLVGHGLAEGGLNQAPAHVGPRELRDEQLLPFEAAVRLAGMACMMPAYCDVDGLPCHASSELLTTILRDEWGFDGIVASDYTAVQMLVGQHRLTGDLGTAAGMALRAGLDSELPATAGYGAPLQAAVDDGRVDPALVDLAVERILRLKFRLGLFERPVRRPAVRRRARPDGRGGALAGLGPRPALDRAAPERRRPAAGRRGRTDRRDRPDRRQRPRPHGRLRPHAAHRDAGRAAPPGQPVRLPLERRHRANRRGGQLADDPRGAPGPVRGIARSRTRRAPPCGTGPTTRSPRPSRPRASRGRDPRARRASG